MTFSEKIDEWIKEAETRPASALMILKLVAGRMRDLTERNEELVSENIALQDGSRVEQYQQRIAYLEFQLDLLKRRFGAQTAGLEIPDEIVELSLLVHNAQGRILRLPLSQQETQPPLGRLTGELSVDGELPRLIAVPTREDVLFLFSSGRVSTHLVADIPALELGGSWAWDQAALPDEPHTGELLVCILPLSRLPVSEFLLQASRRGCVKKTLATISEKILATHYLGRGANQKSDQPFDVLLAEKKSRFALVTYEGRLLGLEVADLSLAAEERIHLTGSDYVVASFVLGLEDQLLCLTQTGKVIQRESGSLDLARSPAARGQALISPTRLDQGTRFVGAAVFRQADQLVVLDSQGNLNLYLAADVCAAGTIRTVGQCLALGVIPAAAGKGSRL